jgi:hypothetical protein
LQESKAFDRIAMIYKISMKEEVIRCV